MSRAQIHGVRILEILKPTKFIFNSFEELSLKLAMINDIKEGISICFLWVIENEDGKTEIFRGFSQPIGLKLGNNIVSLNTPPLLINPGVFRFYLAVSNLTKDLFYDVLDVNSGLDPVVFINNELDKKTISRNIFDLKIHAEIDV
jgi:hypothetical protein